MKLGYIAVIASLGPVLLMPGSAFSQSITLTSPSNTANVADGDDYATDVLKQGWNMNRIRDVAYEDGFFQPAIVNGVWEATTSSTTAYIEPLFPGFNEPAYTMYFSRYDEGTPYGPLNPVDTAKYTRFSMRSSWPAANRTSLALLWGTQLGQFPDDGIFIQDTFPTIHGFRMYDIDLTGNTWLNEKNVSLTPLIAPTGSGWSGAINAFLIWPTSPMPVFRTCKIDWMRLYDPTTSPTLTFQWNTSGVPNNPAYAVQLWADDNASGYNGSLFVSGIENDGDYTIYTASLPPGTHYFYLKVVTWNGSALVDVATSGYSAALNIAAPPLATFNSPSYSSGEEFSASELSNSWDMSDSADIKTFSDIYFSNFSGGTLSALAGSSDPLMELNMKENGANRTINPRKYRYFSFRMNTDTSQTTSMTERIINGWVARLFWWNSNVFLDGSTSKDIPLLEGWHRYTIDMWDPAFVETRPTGTPQFGWSTLPVIKGLRLDPLEVFTGTWFELDDVKLCAENKRINNGSFLVEWNLSDADSSTCDVKLFYGYTENGGPYVEEPTPLLDQAQAPGTHSYNWDMADMPNGDYYLRLELDDGVNVRSCKSELPLIIDDSYPRIEVSGMDPTIYYRGNGWWITLHSDGGGYTIEPWGHWVTDPVPADYDGDGKMDRAVFHKARGDWYIQESSTGLMMSGDKINWGWSSTVPAPADFDGDGKADLAVFEPATGQWWILQSSDGTLYNGGPVALGWNGSTPVPADYDGDNIDDIAVYGDGQWYIIQSSDGQLKSGGPISWGWPGVTPVPADYDGDNKADIAIYASNGEWWILLSSTGQAMNGGAVEWGWDATSPVPGDFDNDGMADLVVCNQSDGMWYFRFSGGGTESGGPWGWNGSQSVPFAGHFNP